MRIRRTRELVRWVLVCAGLLTGWQGAAALRQATADAGRVAAMRTFAEGTERYARLRARLEEPLPSFDARPDSWSLMLTRRYLASAIRTARSHARQGDIFMPPIAQLFRGLIGDAIYNVDIEGLVVDNPEGTNMLVDVEVNEPVPVWALQDLPDALLQRLPALPDAIAYRMVGGSLILWDMHAEIVVDALPGAFVVE